MKREPVQTTSSNCRLRTDACDGTSFQAEAVGRGVGTGVGEGVGRGVELASGVTIGVEVGPGLATAATATGVATAGGADGVVLEHPATRSAERTAADQRPLMSGDPGPKSAFRRPIERLQ